MAANGRPRRWRYRISSVWGTVAPALSIGDVIQDDEWKGNQGTWEVFNDKDVAVGGWEASYIGEAT